MATERDPYISKVFRRGARKALIEWMREGDDVIEELVDDLWVWYLESPGTQRSIAALDEAEAVFWVRRVALQILSKQSLAGDLSTGSCIYSSESVKDVLKDRSTNRYLKDILPVAIELLDKRNSDHAEAIRSRYTDGLVPAQGAPAELLRKAHQALTSEVNIIAITAGVDTETKATRSGPGSRAAVFPDTRKSSSSLGYSDPTGDEAVNLVTNGDVPIDLHDKFNQIVGQTTWRKIFYEQFTAAAELGIEHGPVDASDQPGVISVFDPTFNGDPHSEMYRSWVLPELFPGQPRALLENWSQQDLEMFVGGPHTPGYASESAHR